MSAQPVGSVEDEARRLVEALRLTREQAGAAPRPLDDDLEGDDGVFTAWPSSRAEAWGREHGPEILRGLADVAALASEGLRAYADRLERSTADATRDQADAPPRPDQNDGNDERQEQA